MGLSAEMDDHEKIYRLLGEIIGDAEQLLSFSQSLEEDLRSLNNKATDVLKGTTSPYLTGMLPSLSNSSFNLRDFHCNSKNFYQGLLDLQSRPGSV